MFTPVPYSHDDLSLVGRLIRPAGRARAAILVFPTIANATPAIERRAAMLADEGYIAMIADFYGFTPAGDEIQQAAKALRRDVSVYRERLSKALDALQAVNGVSGLPVAAIGYCMGGQAALELARSGAQIAGAISFHGLLTTDRKAALNEVKARLLICHGESDPLAPHCDVLAFWDEMNAAAGS